MSDKDMIKEKEIARLLDQGKVVVIAPSKGAVIVKTFAYKLSP